MQFVYRKLGKMIEMGIITRNLEIYGTGDRHKIINSVLFDTGVAVSDLDLRNSRII